MREYPARQEKRLLRQAGNNPPSCAASYIESTITGKRDEAGELQYSPEIIFVIVVIGAMAATGAAAIAAFQMIGGCEDQIWSLHVIILRFKRWGLRCCLGLVFIHDSIVAEAFTWCPAKIEA
jgi:hypothetical protein